MRIRSDCRTDFTAVHMSGTRDVRGVRLIVLHDEEAPTARAAAEWFANPASEGSAHLCVDADECYRCLPDNVTPWAAANANTIGFHIEQAGYASQSRHAWLANMRLLRRSAFKAAQAGKRFGIPMRFVDADGIAAGKRGVTTHAEVSKWSAAHGLPGDHSHTDPGPNFPMKVWLGLAWTYRGTLGPRLGARRHK